MTRKWKPHNLSLVGKGDQKGGSKGEKTLNDFAVEYAKSNRSTCKGCEQKIEKVSSHHCKPFEYKIKLMAFLLVKLCDVNIRCCIPCICFPKTSDPLASPLGSDSCVQENRGSWETPAGSDRPLVPHGVFREPQGGAGLQTWIQRCPAEGFQLTTGWGQGRA